MLVHVHFRVYVYRNCGKAVNYLYHYQSRLLMMMMMMMANSSLAKISGKIPVLGGGGTPSDGCEGLSWVCWSKHV